MSLGAAAFVGNSLGENKPKKALTYVKANMLLTLLFAVMILWSIIVFQDSIVGSYTNSTDIMKIFKKALPLFMLFNFGDFIFYITEGILIGVGYQKILVFLIFLWMWVFMIPSAYWAIILYNCGFIDIWIIFWIARMLLALSNIVVIFVTNWKSVAEKASQSDIST